MKVRSSLMIPLRKSFRCWWYGETEDGFGPIEEHILPVGTLVGYWSWENSKRCTLMSFVAMVSPGDFKRYQLFIGDK